MQAIKEIKFEIVIVLPLSFQMLFPQYLNIKLKNTVPFTSEVYRTFSVALLLLL